MIIVELKGKDGTNILTSHDVLVSKDYITIKIKDGIEHHKITQHSRQARDGCYLIKATVE